MELTNRKLGNMLEHVSPRLTEIYLVLPSFTGFSFTLASTLEPATPKLGTVTELMAARSLRLATQ